MPVPTRVCRIEKGENVTCKNSCYKATREHGSELPRSIGGSYSGAGTSWRPKGSLNLYRLGTGFLGSLGGPLIDPSLAEELEVGPNRD